jgi:hypothetical protein
MIRSRFAGQSVIRDAEGGRPTLIRERRYLRQTLGKGPFPYEMEHR